MSFHVLVIPEDFRQDQYVLKPIITRMMKAIGVSARVEVCRDPAVAVANADAVSWMSTASNSPCSARWKRPG